MKRTIIHTSAAIALLLGIAACTQDEAGFLPEGAEGTPIVFTATGLNPDATATAGTRAPVDGNWEGVQSVAVLMDGTVKAYDVTPTTADNTGATLTSDDPHYWTNHDNITVTAWWPYTAGETTPPAVVVKADQSARKDFEGSDLIVAEEQTVSYGNTTLRFTHRTAQITVVLTDYTEGMASVRLTGLSTENGNPPEIAPYDKGGDTYTVTTADGLLAWNEAVQKDMTLNCTLADNIDLTGIDWMPIGTSIGNSYTGTFDGGGHTITGLTVTGSDRYTGLFGFIKGTVKNVVLEGVRITSDNSSGYAGGVAGYSFEGNIENCSVSGSVSGSDVGGVVGYQQGGSITGCSSSATVKGTQRAGGVAGTTNYDATLTACYATGDMTVENDGTSNACAGGVVGSNAYCTVIACYAAGNVSGTGSGTIHVGGVTGENFDGTLTACYWSGLPDNDNGGATKVDGTTVTWQTAVDAMNAALSGKGWQYELTGELPTLKK